MRHAASSPLTDVPITAYGRAPVGDGRALSSLLSGDPTRTTTRTCCEHAHGVEDEKEQESENANEEKNARGCMADLVARTRGS